MTNGRSKEVVAPLPVTGLIHAGESLSEPINVTGTLHLIAMPIEWTPANITFQISPDGVTFFDLMTADNTEVMFNITAGSAVNVAPGSPLDNKTFIKVRSGSRDHPVVQSGDRTFIFAAS